VFYRVPGMDDRGIRFMSLKDFLPPQYRDKDRAQAAARLKDIKSRLD
jgi:hypothetical protein